MDKPEPLNLLVTLDANYLSQLNTLLVSLHAANPALRFDVYLLHSSIQEQQLRGTRQILDGWGRLLPVNASEYALDDAPTTDRYPKEIYYRIFASRYLPDTLDRVLYLDPDIVVNGSLLPLYDLPLGDCYFAAATHIHSLLRAVNGLRLDMDEDGLYINSGVMLMNLALLRQEQRYEDVFRYIEAHRNALMLPDQDIISALYGDRIYPVDAFYYNMTDRLYQRYAPFNRGLTLDWVRRNSAIIHYCGRNKPWKGGYVGRLGIFYEEAVQRKLEEFPEAL